MTDDVLRLAREVIEKATDKIEYKIAEDKEGRVWLCIDNSGHDIEIGDMETEDVCCYAAYNKLFGFANAAPILASAVIRQAKEIAALESVINKALRGFMKQYERADNAEDTSAALRAALEQLVERCEMNGRFPELVEQAKKVLND